jgi:hypothetical protein
MVYPALIAIKKQYTAEVGSLALNAEHVIVPSL